MIRRHFIKGVATISLISQTSMAFSALNGKFFDNLDLRLLPDGRNAELLADFTYEDSDGNIWHVPAKTVVNGSSIPPQLWSFVNASPYVGLHRFASVIHDHFCDTEERPWPATHRVYYNGCLTAGMGKARAKAFYYAVYSGGPRWERSLSSNSIIREKTGDLSQNITKFKDLLELTADLTVEEIETLAEKNR